MNGLSLSAVLVVCAAAAQDTATFSTSVKVVNVFATVFDKHHELIRDLGQNDFAVTEDGVPQTIRYFARESDLPLTVGLLVDTSMSQEHVISDERRAAFHFLDHVIRRRDDRVFVTQFDLAVMPKAELTNDFRVLDEALTSLDTPSRQELRMQTGGGTLLYDAVIESCNKILANQSGRKAAIVLSDGVDEGSDASLQQAIDAAQRSETLVYAILFSDPAFYGVGFFGMPEAARGRAALSKLSRETGGGFFEVSRHLSIDAVFARIEDELRSEYSLGYVSNVPVKLSGFRKIRLTVARKGLTVQARDRYWAQR
jgi:VWFA-related protein